MFLVGRSDLGVFKLFAADTDITDRTNGKILPSVFLTKRHIYWIICHQFATKKSIVYILGTGSYVVNCNDRPLWKISENCLTISKLSCIFWDRTVENKNLANIFYLCSLKVFPSIFRWLGNVFPFETSEWGVLPFQVSSWLELGQLLTLLLYGSF